MAGGATPRYDQLTAVEYSTLRVPYETLNRKFRKNQKDLERVAFRFSKENEMNLKKKLREGKEGKEWKAEEMAAPLSSAISSLEQAISMATSSIDDEIRIVDEMMTRISFLQCGLTLDDHEDEDSKKLWNLKRTDKMVAEQLLRFGYIDTAKMLVHESRIQPLVDIEPYEKAAIVIQSLQHRNTASLHEWIDEHRSRLKKVPGNLEVTMWMQDAIECVRKNDKMGALAIMRKHITPSGQSEKRKGSKDGGGDTEMMEEGKKEKNDLKKLPGEFQQVMTLIVLGAGAKAGSCSRLLEESRWNALINMFIATFKALYQLPEHTAFSVALQVGLCAHKTPWCTPNGNSLRAERRKRERDEIENERAKMKWTPREQREYEDKKFKEEKEKKKKDDCPCCDPVCHKIAEGLPLAHRTESRLFCAHTRELINEDNQPYQLPSGYVYGEKGLALLERDDDKYYCPRSGETYHRSSALRLYIL